MSADVLTTLHALVAKRILVLDGAMGTMIQRHKLTEADFRGDRFAGHPHDVKGNNDLLVLTRPDVVSAIHHEYLEAGSDIIETNSFSSTAIAQADYGLEPYVYELNVEAGRLAKAAAVEWTLRTPEKPRFVAGSMGPTNRILSISPDVDNPAFRAITFDELRDAYKDQVRGLIDGGCDLLLLETIVDTLNAKAGIVAIEEVFEEKGVRLPLMISVTVTDRSGRTLSGQTIDAFWVSIAHAKPFSVGINCALGARDMRPYVADLARIADCYVSCYPNAGLPNTFGEYDETTGRHRRLPPRVCRERLCQHRRRMLRHDPGPHSGDRGRGGGRAAADRSERVARRLADRRAGSPNSPALKPSPSGPTAPSR